MKRMKRRIILGTTAVAAALTIGGCSGARLEDAGTAATVQESGSETGNEQNAGETILDFEEFDVEQNINNVVYGPPAE